MRYQFEACSSSISTTLEPLSFSKDTKLMRKATETKCTETRVKEVCAKPTAANRSGEQLMFKFRDDLSTARPKIPTLKLLYESRSHTSICASDIFK